MGYRVAVAGWQWRGWIGCVIASILIGDKLEIGAPVVFFFKKKSGSGRVAVDTFAYGVAVRSFSYAMRCSDECIL
jgi:hypothetical protein